MTRPILLVAVLAVATTVSSASADPNNHCFDALPLTFNSPRLFNTTAATPDGAATCDDSAANADIWYRIQFGQYTADLDITICNADFDAVVSVFLGCGGPEIACGRAGCGSQALTLCGVYGNADIRIRVSGVHDARGTGAIEVTQRLPSEPPLAPPDCVSEGEVCSQINPDTYNAGCDGPLPPRFQTASLCVAYCATAAQDGLGARDTDWFNYTLPGPGTLTLYGQCAFPARWYLFPGATTIDCNAISVIAGPSINLCRDSDLMISATFAAAGDVIFYCSRQNLPGDSTCSIYAHYWFRAEFDAAPCGTGCNVDFNCDGSADQGDVGCIIDVVAGNSGCECRDPDFNRDGNTDQDDVAALINVVAGGPCP